MKNLFTFLALILVGSTANAAIIQPVVCEGPLWHGRHFKLTIGENIYKLQNAKLEVFDENGNVVIQSSYSDLNNVWDGHLTGLITGPGLSVRYDNDYGCIRRVQVTADFGNIQTASVRVCRGGSIPDAACFESVNPVPEIR